MWSRAAFASGIPPDIYAFHHYTGNSSPLPLSVRQFQTALPVEPGLSRRLRPPARALRPVIPDNSLVPTFYRGCWHVVSRTRIPGTVLSLPQKSLRPEGLLPSAVLLRQAFAHCAIFAAAAATVGIWSCVSTSVGVTLSRPLPVFAPSEPLPHQLADGTLAPPRAHQIFSLSAFSN